MSLVERHDLKQAFPSGHEEMRIMTLAFGFLLEQVLPSIAKRFVSADRPNSLRTHEKSLTGPLCTVGPRYRPHRLPTDVARDMLRSNTAVEIGLARDGPHPARFHVQAARGDCDPRTLVPRRCRAVPNSRVHHLLLAPRCDAGSRVCPRAAHASSVECQASSGSNQEGFQACRSNHSAKID